MSYAYSSIGPDDALRLRDEHAFLNRQLNGVIQLAEQANWRACELLWEVFYRELEHHMRYEENMLFPAFCRSGVAPDLWTERRVAEHAEFRSECRRLGNELLQSTFRIEPLLELASKLRQHDEREERVVHPWLASLERPLISWGAMRFLVFPPAPKAHRF